MGQRPVQVTEVLDNSVVVDGNHPLAGQSLNFSVQVVDVRAASEEEVAHGHIHAHGGCGGHHHHDHDEGGCCGGHEHKEETKPGCDGNGGCGCH